MKLRQVPLSKMDKWQRHLLELRGSVEQSVEDHWEQKISEGIIPAAVKESGQFDPNKHLAEMAILAEFEADAVAKWFGSDVEIRQSDVIPEVHYFGPGTGLALSKVVFTANLFGYRVNVYDTCSIGLDNAEKAFENSREGIENKVLLADMLFACKKRYIDPKKSRKLIASRVLDVLDKQEPNWEKKPEEKRKTARTLQALGRLSTYLDILIIHRPPEDNTTSVWGDSTPYTLEKVLGYIQKGAEKVLKESRIEMEHFGSAMYYGELHRAVVFRCKR